jgi:hypothetical protein
VHWTNNVIHSALDSCYHNHEGFNIVVRNNILDGTGFALRSASPTPAPTHWHAAANYSRNIFVTHTSEIFQQTATSEWAGSTFDDNVYFRTDTRPVAFPGNVSLATWQKSGAGTEHGGQDRHSANADPKFKNLDANDYALDPTSPALHVGFQPIDLTTVGPRPTVQ